LFHSTKRMPQLPAICAALETVGTPVGPYDLSIAA
jgi:hypothetical protein